ncbi:hypothetical protein J2T15_001411 [Paenibacillus harenae]|uniref:Uncharacterized protein n=1 Tax=Paenibacillus harenae TaxID=306543 RepID=A0ABT9TX83_PAEHA|nr:hypothetical protein [Paenibacillus harenae]
MTFKDNTFHSLVLTELHLAENDTLIKGETNVNKQKKFQKNIGQR